MNQTVLSALSDGSSLGWDDHEDCIKSVGEVKPMSLLADVNPIARRILIGNGFSALGSGLTLPFLVIYLGEVRGLGTTTGGLIVAYLAIITLLAAFPIGALVDHWGPRRVLIVSLGLAGVGVSLLGFVTTTPSALFVVTLIAIGQAGIWSPQSALYARVTPSEFRQKIFGLQFMMLNLGLGIGGLFAAVIVNVKQPETFTALYLLDSCTFFIYATILLTLRGIGDGPHEGTEARQPDGGYSVVLRDRAMMRLLTAALVLLVFGYGSLEVGLPVYATVIGDLNVGFVGIAYAVNTGFIVLSQLFVIKLLRGRSRSRSAALVGLIWAIAWLLVGVSIEFNPAIAGALIFLGVAIFALGETLWAPVIPAIVNDLAPESLRGRYNAALSMIWGIAGTVGPAFAGVALGLDLPYLWVTTVVLGCALAGLLLLRLRHLLTPSQDGMIMS